MEKLDPIWKCHFGQMEEKCHIVLTLLTQMQHDGQSSDRTFLKLLPFFFGKFYNFFFSEFLFCRNFEIFVENYRFFFNLFFPNSSTFFSKVLDFFSKFFNCFFSTFFDLYFEFFEFFFRFVFRNFSTFLLILF